MMLKLGYALILVAGIGLIGFAGYHAVLALIRAPDINLFFKGLILCAGIGVGLTLIGLVIERRKESKNDPRDDESD